MTPAIPTWSDDLVGAVRALAEAGGAIMAGHGWKLGIRRAGEGYAWSIWHAFGFRLVHGDSHTIAAALDALWRAGFDPGEASDWKSASND